MIHPIRELRNIIGLIKEMAYPDKSIYRVGRVSNPLDIKRVRQFAFDVYIKRGEIPAHLLNDEGMLGDDKDPYVHHSVYFAVFDIRTKKIVGASRLILPIEGKGAASLQIDIATLGKRAQAYVAACGPRIVEPAAYAKAKGAPWVVTLYLLREMLHYSLDQKIEYWLIALNPHIERTYVRRFGGALHKLGKRVLSKVDLEGRRPENVPYIMNVQNALINVSRGSGYHGWLLAPLVKRFFMHRLHMTDHRIIRAR